MTNPRTKYRWRTLGRWAAILGACAAVRAGSATYDFNAGLPPELKAVGSSTTDPDSGAFIQYPEWRSEGGVNNSGYVALFDSVDSMYAAMLIPDFDAGLVVKAFTFEVDLRIGNATGEGGRPADGFSISYARADDPVVQDLSQDPPVYNGNNFYLGGAPENGTRTGLVISFDSWSGNTQPDGGPDLEGIMIIVDGQVLEINGQRGVPMPTRNGACDDPTSMQTGPWTGGAEGSGPSDVSGLCWARLKVEVDDQQRVTVTWKGQVIANQIPTGFAPGAGRIVFAGRTGGANQNVHIDNLTVTTVPADNIIIGAATGGPVGFTVQIVDSGASVLDPDSVTLKLDGLDVPTLIRTKTGTTSTVGWYDVTKPLVPGSVHTVQVTARDTRGNQESKTLEFTVPNYVTIPPGFAVTDVNTAQRGFNVRVHQTAARGQENTIARAEQQLQELRGANVADLTGFTGGVYTETDVINYSQMEDSGVPGQNGAFQENNGWADLHIPGIPSATEFPGPGEGSYYTDNIAGEITTYLHFPEAGVYELIFNSDDGFRTTTHSGVNEVLASVIVGQFDGGRGASDTVSLVYVPQAGYYPFRTVWFEGGGGANLEWSGRQTVPTATSRQLLNSSAEGSIKAYRSRSTAGPAVVSFVHPARGSGNPYLPTTSLMVKIQDGTAAVDQDSIKLLLNGSEVAVTKSKVGNTTTVTHQPTGLLPAGEHQLKVMFTAGAQTYEATNTFTIADLPVVPPSLALPASAVNTANRGFLVKTVQHASYQDLGTRGNDTYSGETQINGLMGLPNTADLSAFTGPQGYYVETDVINYWSTGDVGYFADANGYPNYPVPGIPGIDPAGAGFPPSTEFPDNGTDNYTQEILTVLELPAGLVAMNVTSDDGFRLTIGNPNEWWTLPVVVGEFSGGRGAGTGLTSGTTFTFYVQQAGLYPARLIWYEGGGGSSVEWSSRLPVDPNTGYPGHGNATLINDSLASGAIKAYRYPFPNPNVPWVKSFGPGRDYTSAGSQARAGSDAPVTAVIVEGLANLDPASVSLTVDGVAVTPTVSKAGGELKVSYTPATPWADGLHPVVLTFGDRTVRWSFQTSGALKTPTFFIEAEDFDRNGQGVAEASQMPYGGGAYAGLTATAGTDYQRDDSASSPLYRHGVNPRVSMDRTGDRTRGVGDIKVNYKLGWIGEGQWYNYTRDIPAGRYHVYAAVSHGDTGATVGGNLATVAGGVETPLGVFRGPAPGGWGNNGLVPLRASAEASEPLAVELAGPTTLRFTAFNGDWDFMLLAPAGVEEPAPRFTGIRRNENGTITVEWTGGGVLQAAPSVTGPWQDVPGATSPYTFTPSEAMLFGRIRR